MLKNVRNKWLLTCSLLVFAIADASASGDAVSSFHVGVLHPNGMDFLGYSVEKHMDNRLYWYYTIGVPSFLAIGITHYNNRDGNGLTATFGAGLGYTFYAAIAYQVKLGKKHFLKLGAAGTIATYYPFAPIEKSYYVERTGIIAYEYRF
ncbi:MAG: hypothetical protein HKN43_07660 [Rhodothermales bacterium]|nr:hypothetical protein [Rhodothermales bacterium]